MLDLAFIRENPELFKEVARQRNTAVDIDALLMIDAQLRKRAGTQKTCAPSRIASRKRFGKLEATKKRASSILSADARLPRS